MINKETNIVVFGAGSIGERHIQNLLNLGYSNLFVFRQRNLPLRNVDSKNIKVFTNFAEIDQVNPQIAFITSPTAYHINQAIECASRGIHLFIEKPLSHNLEGFDNLVQVVKQKGVYLRVGYMMRFHPIITQIKELVLNQKLGNLLSFSSHWGEYLPDWHPWEDYRTSYAARNDLGGGAALTLSHDIDLVNWLVGAEVVDFKVFKGQPSRLEVEVDAGADILIKYSTGVFGHVHLNYFEQVPSRYLRMVFDKGSIHFDYYRSELKVETKEEQEIYKLKKFDRNQLFIDQLKDFLSKIEDYEVEESLSQIKESQVIIKICLTE